MKKITITHKYRLKDKKYEQRLDEHLDNIRNEFEFIKKEYKRLADENFDYVYTASLWQEIYCPEIVKMVSNRVLLGYNLDEAITMTAFQTERTKEQIRAIWGRHASPDCLCRKYATKYLIFTLRVAGFNIADIARISHKGRQFVTKTLKEDFIL